MQPQLGEHHLGVSVPADDFRPQVRNPTPQGSELALSGTDFIRTSGEWLDEGDVLMEDFGQSLGRRGSPEVDERVDEVQRFGSCHEMSFRRGICR
jgi:hypothetical protein